MQGLDQRLSHSMAQLQEDNDRRWETMEEETKKRLDTMEEEGKENLRREIGLLKDQLYTAYQKMGLVRYNAFDDLVGELSFSLVMLDEHRNGFVLTSIYARQASNSFAKVIKNGECPQSLSPEEEEALAQALAR